MAPRGRKLLLADDSVTIQRVIELTFAEEDVEVFAVGDGKQAIDRIRADRPDIVLADVGMPERDGYDVAAFVKGDPALAHIPVLLLTGAFEPIDEGRARAVGCDGVLVKPFEPQMVINRVKDLLAGRRPAGQEPAPQDAASSSASPAEPQKAGSDSLEDYFDRLDAAFATLGGDAAPAAASRPAAAPASASAASAVAASEPATVEDFASWDPDLAGESNRPARHHEAAASAAAPAPIPVASLPSPVAAPAVQPIPLSSAPAPAAAGPPRSRRSDRVPAGESAPAAAPSSHASLAEAFASLLAAEHGQTTAPIPFASPAPAPTPAVDVDDIVRRVLDRLQDDDMRRTVVETAERLVRDEIERIKRAGV
jgi:CheY-like chemotaxis protein